MRFCNYVRTDPSAIASHGRPAVITANTIYKKWARVFNNDAPLTTAILDRLIHHCETIIIEGDSYRTKKRA